MNQRELILKYIKEFGSITSFEAYIDLGITQLATRIKELKEQGYSFSYEWISKKNRYGKKVAFKKYKLEEEVRCQ
jgi:esterase/lipase superfamily enzyme